MLRARPSRRGGILTPDADGYYLIEDAADLAAFRDGVNDGTYVTASARLTADIDLSEYGSWTPIAESSNESSRYSGTFDGGGHTISNFNITGSYGAYGLFGYIGTGGTVKNLSVNAEISASNYGHITAGIIAAFNYGTIENCSTSGSVRGESRAMGYAARIGGIAGENYGTVRNCANSATVYSSVRSLIQARGTANSGGIVGYNSGAGAKVINCINTGITTTDNSTTLSTRHVGGVVGESNSGTVENSAYLSGTANSAVGSDSDATGVTMIESESALDAIAVALLASIDKTSLEAGVMDDTATITLVPAPGTLDKVYGQGVRNASASATDGNTHVINITDNDDGTFTVTQTGMGEGTAEITVTADLYEYGFSESSYSSAYETITFSFYVAVSNVPLESIEIPTSAEVNAGGTTALSVTYTPSKATNKAVTWTSDTPDVATVDENGKVTGVNVGTARITATSDENPSLSATCEVTVSPVLVTEISVSPDGEYAQLETEKEYTFTASVLPDNATDKRVTWSVSGTSAGTWETNPDGSFTITTNTQAGYVAITATASDEYNTGEKPSDTLTYSVIIPNVESVTITPDSATITGGIGDTATLTAAVLPSNAQYDAIEWKSENESVATVEAGENNTATVTAKGAGTVTITATAGGVEGECEITVAEVPATGVTVNGGTEEITLEEGGSAQLEISLEPSNSTDKITWTSSDYAIVYVDEDGKITAIAPGTAVVTATAASGRTASVTITVTETETPGEGDTGGNNSAFIGDGCGCNAGLGALALLAAVPFALRRKK